MEPGVALALASALAFGLCDFVAGIASRRISFWWVALISLGASVVGAWLIVLVSRESANASALLWGFAAGVGAATGAVALYRGYGHGQMAVAGPISAVGAAALPAAVGLILGERLAAVGIIGVAVALPAIWLMSGAKLSGDHARRGASDGLLSGAGFALEFVGLERAGESSGLWPVAISQSTALVLVGLVVAVVRPRGRGDARTYLLAAIAGALSLVATTAYFLAAHAGLLTVAAVLASLYPAVTVVLAAAFLHERPARAQVVGLVLGGLAVTLIVLG